MKITYDDYDRCSETFEKMKTAAYLPTAKQIEMFEKDPEKWLMFCIYCHDRAPAAKDLSEEDREKKEMLQEFISRHLELVDSDEDM